MPRGYNLNAMEYDRLHELLEYDKKDPNDFLKSAIASNRLDLLPLLFDYGANAQDLVGEGTVDAFLDTCNTDIAEYLSYFFIAPANTENPLYTVINELDNKYFNKRFFANRHATYEPIEKIGMWSIGLTELEAKNTHFLESMNIICDVGSWNDRFVNVDPDKGERFVITTIEHIALNKVSPQDLAEHSNSEFLSPNISHLFKIYLVNQYEFKNLIADLTWAGRDKFIGIAYAEMNCLFSNDGRIDSKIYDLMKNEYCRKVPDK